MNKKLFKDYAKLENQIKALEAKQNEIKKGIQEEMDKEMMDKQELDFGTFYFTSRRTYKYSPTVQNLDIELKKIKNIEEETAEFTESRSLAYRAKVTKE